MISILVFLVVILNSIDYGFSASPEQLACLRQERAAVENPAQNIIIVYSQQPAYLHCKTQKGTSQQVAWTRAADQALLTAGQQSFTSDPRFQVSKKTDEDWILIIRRTDLTDTGCYLCEVNTEPFSSVYAVYLDVKESPTPSPLNSKKSAKLMANMNGNEVLLNCTVALGDSAEDEIVWTRDGKAIDLNNTNKYVWKVKRATGVVVHTVRIRSATMDDDGDYACQNKYQRANQIVHVNRAEAQKSSSAAVSLLSLLLFSVAIFL